MGHKTPQQKKRLAYLRERRNAYGENSKSSRKSIRRRKALVNRANRRAAETALSLGTKRLDEDDLDGLDASLHGHRPKRWRKIPDAPLAEHVHRVLVRRVRLGVAGATAGRVLRLRRLLQTLNRRS